MKTWLAIIILLTLTSCIDNSLYKNLKLTSNAVLIKEVDTLELTANARSPQFISHIEFYSGNTLIGKYTNPVLSNTFATKFWSLLSMNYTI